MKRFLIAAFAALLIIAAVSPFAERVFYRLASSKTPQLMGESFTRVDMNRKLVALTYDDGPLSPYTDSILDILSRKNVKAHFFLIGRNTRNNPQLAGRIIKEGHGVGNHTWSHKDMILKSPSFIKREIEKTDSIIRSLGYGDYIYFRSPRGMKLVVLPWYLRRTGRINVLFDVVPVDWQDVPMEEMLRKVIENVKPGSIILLHDGGGDRSETVKLTGPLIDSLTRRGYSFATVSQLLKSSGTVPPQSKDERD
ncbi:MAG: polysaccharide deacetylase family protein [Chitinispirillaceae bacterium]